MLGIHVDKKKWNTLPKLIQEGFTAFQIFTAGPMNSKLTKLTSEEIELFSEISKKAHIYVHSSYVTFPWNGKKFAIMQIKKEMDNALQITNKYVIHLPKYEEIERDPAKFVEILTELSKIAIEEGVELILELQAYSENSVERVNKLLTLIKKAKCWLCIDTAHVWSSGIDISTASLFKAWYNKLRNKNRILLFHFNNSSVKCGSHVDKHAAPDSGIMWKGKELGKMKKFLIKTKKDIIIETY